MSSQCLLNFTVGAEAAMNWIFEHMGDPGN